MNRKRFAATAALAMVGSLVLASCSTAAEQPTDKTSSTQTPAADLSGTVTGVGATSMGAGQTAWKAAFELANSGVTVAYDALGSGNGRRAFKEGGADFAGSDRALKKEELIGNSHCVADSKAIDLPIWISPIAVAFKLDGIDSLNLDANTIAKIFKGDITKWNDAAIASQNKAVTLPDLAITRVVRSDPSGTTGNFTDYLEKAAADWGLGSFEEWDNAVAETADKADGTSGVVKAIEAGTGTIGYLDASRASAAMGTVAVKVGDEYVSYTPEAAAAVVNASPLDDSREDNDLVVKLVRDTTESGVYPIVLISYAIACADYQDDSKAELVKAYLSYVASPAGQKEAEATAGNAPISGDIQTKVLAAIADIK